MSLRESVRTKAQRGSSISFLNRPKAPFPKMTLDMPSNTADLCAPPQLSNARKSKPTPKRFYGFEARLAKKAEKENRLAVMRERTAHNVRARVDKSRTEKRSTEIERIAGFWNIPEITRAKTVKHARLIDEDLNRMAETWAEPIEILCSPYLSKPKGVPEQPAQAGVANGTVRVQG
jgi:hypothetical protein